MPQFISDDGAGYANKRTKDSFSNPEENALKSESLKIQPLEYFSEAKLQQLFSNSKGDNRHKNHYPVSYLIIPKLEYRFLITELDAFDKDTAFGLCDYCANLKIESFSLNHIFELAEKNDGSVKSVTDFEARYNLAVYAQVASEIGTLVTGDNERGYQESFLKHATGKNCDGSLSLHLLHNKLEWL